MEVAQGQPWGEVVLQVVWVRVVCSSQMKVCYLLFETNTFNNLDPVGLVFGGSHLGHYHNDYS